MKHWRSFARSIAEILWPSFLVACLATAVVFSQADPTLLLHAVSYTVTLSEMAIYSLGFFFFWLICALASACTLWLVRTERRAAEFPTTQDQNH